MNTMTIPSFSTYSIDIYGNVYDLVSGKTVRRFIKNGRNCVNLYKYVDGNKIRTSQYVSRLMAETFIPGYDSSLCVKHCDGDMLNDQLHNLVCVTKSNALKSRKCTTHPEIIDESTGEIFCTYAEAARSVGGHRNGVYLCAIGIQSDHKGHKFKYASKK